MAGSIKPKKSLGQHWLHEASILSAICDDADIQAGDRVLEVGPGLGTLTERLLHRGAAVMAVEFDRVLADKLKKRNWGSLPETASLTVVEQDILSFNLTGLEAPYKVAANIPYYLTSNLIRLLMESTNPPALAALLVQKEVAERITSEPGDMSILSVTTQFYCDVKLGTPVPAHFFTPPPKVDSQVVVLIRREQPLYKDVNSKKFFSLVKAGFSQKRKTLQNALSGGLRLSKQDTAKLISVAGLSPMLRAEALGIEDWKKLYDVWINQS